MRTAFVSFSPLLLLLALCAQPAIATTGTGTLTIVSESGYNKMNVAVTPLQPVQLSPSTKPTTVTGTVDAQVAADPRTGATTALTLSGNNLSMSDLSYSWYILFLKVASLDIRGMRGYASTTSPPGLVTPNSNGGSFDGSLHKLIINQGIVTGSSSADLSQTPIQGVGTGTGSITMVAGTATNTHRNFTTTIVIPVDFTDIINSGAATVRVQGTLKANGTISMPLNDFIAWTDQNGLAGAPFTEPVVAGAAPLGFAWATGLEPTAPLNAITPIIQATSPSLTAILTLPATGTRAPLWIENSTGLTNGSWNPVAASELSTGVNPVPAGTSGVVTIQLSGAPPQFIRLRVNSP